jgi:hypothetical protein
MKTCMLIVFLVTLLAFPVGTLHAQEDSDQTECALELEELILALVQAQRDADTGNAYQAVQTLDTVQAQLATLVTECEGVLFPLPESFTAIDESIAFNYPAGWTFFNLQAGVYMVASSSTAADILLDSDLNELPEDAQVLLVMVIDLEESGEALTFDDYVQAFVDEELDSSFGQVGGPVPLAAGDRVAQRLTVHQGALAGYLDLFDYTSAEQPAIVVVGGFAASSELAMLEPILKAFAKHMRYPARPMLRKPGVPLDTLAYTQGIGLGDFVEVAPYSTALAPDGSAIAWYALGGSGEICLLALPEYTVTCDPIPDRWRARGMQLYWSPDSAYVAWTGNFFQYFDEVDLMLYDVAARQVRNATDDGIVKWDPIRRSDETGPVWIDATFTWGPDGYLYFVRDVLEDTQADRDTMRTGLYRLDPTGGEPELIRDLTGRFEIWSIYPSPEYNLDGVLSISPDARQIAFVVRYHELDAPQNGIYVMDLTGDATPVMVADTNDLQAGYPIPRSGGSGPLYPMSVAWNMDGSGLYVWSSMPAEIPPLSIPHYIDLTSGVITPLLDFSTLETAELFKEDETTGYPPVFLMPRAVVLAPDGSGLLALHFWDDIAGLSAFQLVDGVPQQTLLLKSENELQAGGRFAMSTLASDGTLLLWGTLFPPEE